MKYNKHLLQNICICECRYIFETNELGSVDRKLYASDICMTLHMHLYDLTYALTEHLLRA